AQEPRDRGDPRLSRPRRSGPPRRPRDGARAMSCRAHADLAMSAPAPLDQERRKTAYGDGAGAGGQAAEGHQLEGQAAQETAVLEVDVGRPESKTVEERDEGGARDAQNPQEER